MNEVFDLPPSVYRRLRDFARRRVADPALAEDLTHEALARALASAGQLRDPARLEAWLFRSLRHTLIDHYRAGRPMAGFADLGLDEAELAAPAAADGADDAAEAAEICVGAMLDTLDGEDGAALAAIYRHGEGQHDLARRLGIPASTAKSRIQRARRRLRRLLDACCRIELDAAGAVTTFEPLAADRVARCGPLPTCQEDTP